MIDLQSHDSVTNYRNISGKRLTMKQSHAQHRYQEAENTKIETYQKEGAWYGKIVSSDNPKAKIGNDILRAFKKEDGQWNGQLFAAKRGKILDAVIEPQKEALNITVSAGFFTKSLVWKREGK